MSPDIPGFLPFIVELSGSNSLSLLFPDSNIFMRTCLSCIFPPSRRALLLLTFCKSTNFCTPLCKAEKPPCGFADATYKGIRFRKTEQTRKQVTCQAAVRRKAGQM